MTGSKKIQGAPKKEIISMFNHIAKRYDFMNHFLSFGMDKSWRRKAIRALLETSPKNVLDIATGTGDLAIMIAKNSSAQITGIDISAEMLKVGKQKIQEQKLEQQISLHEGDSENINFDDNTFDGATVAFGVRNFENLQKGISEIQRVLKPEAKFVVLEFSKPSQFPFKQLYHFYSFYIMPYIGKLFAKNQAAYKYLPESIRKFPDGQDFLNVLSECGFEHTHKRPLTMGSVTIYSATKPA